MYLHYRVYAKWYTAYVSPLAESTGLVHSEVAHIDQSISMVPGRPSVLFRLQLVHILEGCQRIVRCDVGMRKTYCGMICMHQQLHSDLC
jgi:hypothetical protein